MKTIIIYKSKTGFTEKYAKWIGEELNAETVPYKNRKKYKLEEYDNIIFGSWFHAASIQKKKWLKKKLKKLEGKKIAVFVTGASPYTEETKPEIEKGFEHNFTKEEFKKLKAFYMQGGLNYERMCLIDRMLMAMLRSYLKKKDPNGEELRLMQNSYDISSKEFILPLLEYING